MTTYCASDGSALAYRESGRFGGVPLIAIHGWQADGSIWNPLLELLGLKHRTIALDLRGCGASFAAPGPYRVETFAQDLAGLLAALDLPAAVLIGHSMGAAVAQRFAIDHPAALAGLVLIAPVPAGGFPLTEPLEAFFRSTAGNAENAARWLSKLTYRQPPESIAALLRDARATVTERAALESLESWTTLAFAEDAATIRTPTLVVAPSHDRPMTPQLVAERVAGIIPGSRLETLTDCGHYAPVEAPERLAYLIDDFVESLSR